MTSQRLWRYARLPWVVTAAITATYILVSKYACVAQSWPDIRAHTAGRYADPDSDRSHTCSAWPRGTGEASNNEYCIQVAKEWEGSSGQHKAIAGQQTIVPYDAHATCPFREQKEKDQKEC